MADYFHGTDREGAESIRENGLDPAWLGFDELTVADRKTAEEYARDTDDPHLVHLRIPDELVTEFLGRHEDHGWGFAAPLNKTVPADFVTAVERLA